MGIQIAHDMFPHVQFQGGSAIHASVYAAWSVPVASPTELVQLASANDWPGQVYNYLTTTFEGFEWLITGEEFRALMLVDLYRLCQGLKATTSDHMLTNPVTGNIFHMIARWGNVVGGVRFWADHYDETVNVGFRFRIEETEEEDVVTRERLRLELEEAVVQHDQLAATGVIVESVDAPVVITEVATKIKVPQKLLVGEDGSVQAEAAPSAAVEPSTTGSFHDVLSSFLGGEKLL